MVALFGATHPTEKYLCPIRASVVHRKGFLVIDALHFILGCSASASVAARIIASPNSSQRHDVFGFPDLRREEFPKARLRALAGGGETRAGARPALRLPITVSAA